MGREVRRVPADWEHPRDERGRYIPLLEGPWEAAVARWDAREAAFNAGLDEVGEPLSESAKGCSFAEWDGERPRREDYMPTWTDAERTHYQMYEDTSEGTPISPVMPSPEALARWCAENGASAFGGMTAGYDWWLRVCGGSG